MRRLCLYLQSPYTSEISLFDVGLDNRGPSESHLQMRTPRLITGAALLSGRVIFVGLRGDQGAVVIIELRYAEDANTPVICGTWKICVVT
jgi:hypothetical protein